MKQKSATLVLIKRPKPSGLFSLDELARRCGVHIAFVEKLVRMGIVDPHPEHRRYFDPEVTLRIRKIKRLKHDLNINVDGAAVVLELLERIDHLEAELSRLQQE